MLRTSLIASLILFPVLVHAESPAWKVPVSCRPRQMR